MQDILKELSPSIVNVAVVVITGLLTFLTTWLREKFRIEIEEKHMRALHSAIKTGVGRGLDKLIDLPQVTRADAAIAEAVSYAERSVPDAIKSLAPSKDHLRDMAVSYAKEKLIELQASDRLTQSLIAAGAQAVDPNARSRQAPFRLGGETRGETP